MGEDEDEDEDRDLPTIEELEATVHAHSQRSRESGLRHFAVDSSRVPTSLTDLSDQELAMIDFKILTQLMAEAGLSKSEVADVKAKRRRLKNRLSARLCSNKKREKCSELEDTNRDLLAKLRQVAQENKTLKSETNRLKEANTALTKSSAEAQREAATLRAQVNQLTQMLARAGLEQNDLEGAAFAA